MDRIAPQYGSTHRFMVSLGVLLLMAPVVLLWLFYSTDPVLVDQTEYDALSSFSKSALDFREQCLSSSGLFIVGAIVLFVAGIFLICFGFKRWSEVQKWIDKQEENKAKHLVDIQKWMDNSGRINFAPFQKEDDVDPTESGAHSEKTVYSDVVTVGEDDNVDANKVETLAPPASIGISEDRSVAKKHQSTFDHHMPLVSKMDYLLVEDICLALVSQSLRTQYDFISQMQTNEFSASVDFVAVAKGRSRDILFEVKYAPHGLKLPILRHATSALIRNRDEYSAKFGKRACCILLVIYGSEVQDVEQIKAKLIKEYPTASSDGLFFVFSGVNHIRDVGIQIASLIENRIEFS